MTTARVPHPSLHSENKAREIQLSPSQIDEFYEIGYLIIPSVFTAEEIAEMRLALNRLQAKAEKLNKIEEVDGSLFVVEPIPEEEQKPVPIPIDAPEGLRYPAHIRIHRIQWAGAAEPTLRKYGEDKRLLSMASQILGSVEMNHLINQVHYKFPNDGIEFPWHQDSQFRRYGTDLWSDINGRGSFVQIGIAIDDMTPHNGPLQFIPRSCQHGHIGLDKLSMSPALQQKRKNTETSLNVVYRVNESARDYFDPADAVSLQLKASDVALFGPYTIHRSLPNNSNQPRRLFLNGYAYPGANKRVYDGDGAGRLISL